MNKREVTFSNLITLLKNRRPLSILGIIFVISSIFIILPGVLFIQNSSVEPYQKYDFDKIDQNGIEQNAKITDLRPVNNVSINGEHPLKISYEFSHKGVIKRDQFQTIELEKTNGMKIGDEIRIKSFENQSKIQNLEPFSFPFYLLYFIPAIFFSIGCVFSAIAVIPALREYRLYKTGVVKEGTIVSLTLGSGARKRNMPQSIIVNYYYPGSNGQKIFGESKTNDFSIINDKKAEDKIRLFVSETDETQSCLVPTLEAMKNNWKISI